MTCLITGIEPVTKSKYKITLNEEFAFVIYRSELLHYRLEEGQELPEDTYRELMEKVLPERGKAVMARMIMESDRTVRQVRERLHRYSYPDPVIEEVIETGLKTGLLDDRRFAESFLFSYRDRKSPRFLRLELARKGVSADIIDELMEEEDPQSEVDAILALLRRKWDWSEEPSFEEEQKRIAFLARKGYSFSAIREAMAAVLTEEE